jgi:FdhE protein
MPHTWNQKIARAKKLAPDSAAGDLLKLYVKAAEFQKKVSEGLKAAGHAQMDSVLQFLPQLKILAFDLGPAPQVEIRVGELGDDRQLWSELLLHYWEGKVPAEDPAGAFLAHVLLQPYGEDLAGRMVIKGGDDVLSCPVCNKPPLLSVLRELNNGAKRSLLCSLCSTEWEFRRGVCPYCGEQHPDKLPVFTNEKFSYVRIEACETCKTYTKCIDLSEDGNAVPEADDLTTISLDFWAHWQGYNRRKSSFFLIPCTTPQFQ